MLNSAFKTASVAEAVETQRDTLHFKFSCFRVIERCNKSGQDMAYGEIAPRNAWQQEFTSQYIIIYKCPSPGVKEP